LRASQGVQILEHLTPRGQEQCLDFRLPSLGPDQTIVSMLQLGDDIKTQFVYLQMVSLFTNSIGARIFRLINLRVPLVQNLSDFFGQMDCSAMSYILVQ
jgi:hypothetical protein